jgi:ferredoxin
MVCLVHVRGRHGLLPACATAAKAGMDVLSETPEIHAARRTALELLLSDHLGDCMAPCQCACPAPMDIPRMIRALAAGDWHDAVVIIKERIALPATLGRICPAPCEKACRRGACDAPLAICLLKRFAADADLAAAPPYQPALPPALDRRVAVVGAGPAGLAAAYYLRRQGIGVTLFDEHGQPGGMLRYGVPAERLPREVLDAEVGLVLALGAAFVPGVRVGRDRSWEAIRREFDAVLLATGEHGAAELEIPGLHRTGRGVEADTHSFLTSLPGFFACGDAVHKRSMAVWAAACGQGAAVSMVGFLRTGAAHAPRRPFTVHMGRIGDDEKPALMEEASPAGRVRIEGDRGLTAAEARAEAARCLHCDCRRAADCRLRIWSERYGALPGRYRTPRLSGGVGAAALARQAGAGSGAAPQATGVAAGSRSEGERRRFEHDWRHADVVYEAGKCIACGLCIEAARRGGERLGLTFIGRGFDVRVRVPFGRGLDEGLRTAAEACVAVCPTGALAFKRGDGSGGQGSGFGVQEGREEETGKTANTVAAAPADSLSPEP